jgi:hypothetical protein
VWQAFAPLVLTRKSSPALDFVSMYLRGSNSRSTRRGVPNAGCFFQVAAIRHVRSDVGGEAVPGSADFVLPFSLRRISKINKQLMTTMLRSSSVHHAAVTMRS